MNSQNVTKSDVISVDLIFGVRLAMDRLKNVDLQNQLVEGFFWQSKDQISNDILESFNNLTTSQ